MHTMGGCDHPLAGDDGSPAGVAVAVVQAHLPGPSPQWSLPSPYDPGQLCSGSTLWRAQKHDPVRTKKPIVVCVADWLCVQLYF